MKPYSPYRKEESQIKGKLHSRKPRSKKIEQEFGPGKKDILLCKKCGAFYWYKSWHHRLSDYPQLKQDKRIKFTLCPACQQILDKRYEGEIILRNVLQHYLGDIKNLAKNYGQRAFEKNPMNRIISIKERKIKRVTTERKRGAASRREFKGKSNVRILTTENQLATRLAKKIREICGGKPSLSISHSHQEAVTRIRIDF